MNSLTTDNRDMQVMEEYYLARIEILEKRLAETQQELSKFTQLVMETYL